MIIRFVYWLSPAHLSSAAHGLVVPSSNTAQLKMEQKAHSEAENASEAFLAPKIPHLEWRTYLLFDGTIQGSESSHQRILDFQRPALGNKCLLFMEHLVCEILSKCQTEPRYQLVTHFA